MEYTKPDTSKATRSENWMLDDTNKTLKTIAQELTVQKINYGLNVLNQFYASIKDIPQEQIYEKFKQFDAVLADTITKTKNQTP